MPPLEPSRRHRSCTGCQGARHDHRDAFVLADSRRTDTHLFRRARADEDDLTRDENGLTNRLRGQLHRYLPQALDLCPSADDSWFWILIEVLPTPA